MSQASKLLPAIPVKLAAIRKVLSITPPLEAKLRAYIAYYTEQQGLDPKHAPTESDTITALIESYLARDSAFNRFLRDKAATARPDSQKKPTPTKDAPSAAGM
jgi:hypothetical protein